MSTIKMWKFESVLRTWILNFETIWAQYIKYILAYFFTLFLRDYYFSLAATVKDHLVSRWIRTQQHYYEKVFNLSQPVQPVFKGPEACVLPLLGVLHGPQFDQHDDQPWDPRRLWRGYVPGAVTQHKTFCTKSLFEYFWQGRQGSKIE